MVQILCHVFCKNLEMYIKPPSLNLVGEMVLWKQAYSNLVIF